jgi:ketosteroid isomerase-like protein
MESSEATPVNPVLRFVDAVNRKDMAGIEAAFHPEFEMVVPQHPARGFQGREQEIKNMLHLLTTYPDCHIEVQRLVEAGSEIWIENHLTASGLEMAAVVIFEIDRDSDTIRRGRYYSDPVDRGGPGSAEWIYELGAGRPTSSRRAPQHPIRDRTPLEIMEVLAATWSAQSMDDPRTTERQLDVFDPDVTIIEPLSLPHGGRHRGIEEYRSLQEHMRALWEQRIESTEFWQCADDRVTLRIVIRWTARATGRSVVLPMIDLIKIRDGKIIEVEAFVQDTKTLIDTLP